ncbi:MAG: TonB-dependent receptor [Bacteroidales bacterium]|nr:TonB-dependent receptor [Bacteroidales bacterium]
MKKTVKQISLIVIAILSLGFQQAFGQAITVQGTVIDTEGEPLIGVSIKVKGQELGVATDIDGHFTLLNVASGSIITAAYVGYQTQEKTAASTMQFVMEEDNKLLDEVVVVGYGTQKKSTISGAVSSVKADKLPSAASESLGTMLRGRAAGMNITQNSANPGGSLNISIRGGLSGQAPLVVIDGVPQVSSSTVSTGTAYSGGDKENSLINLNPADIESIDILKDASAASIYGSDASGGVILITTKRGKEGKPVVNYSGSVALQWLKDKPKFMNARDFMTVQNQVFDELGRGNEKYYTQRQIDEFVGDGTDWLDEVTRTGVLTEHNLSVTGGNAATQYLFSLGYMDHQAIAKNNSMNRITGRMNLDQTFSQVFKAGVSSNFTQIKYNDVPLGDSRQDNSALIYSAMTFNPTVSVYDEDGSFAGNPIRDIYPNPVSLLEITDETTSRDLFITGYLEYKPWKFLSLRVNGGFDLKDTQHDQYIPTTTKKGFATNGMASKQNARWQMNMVNIIANYNNTFGGIHDLGVMAGWEYKKQSWNGMGIVAKEFPTDGSLMNNIGTSQEENPDISSFKGSSEMASFIGRVNYSLMERYILTFNIRVDGSSNFSKDHQWGAFPGVSLAWRMKQEKWMNSATWLNDLKLRAGYGQTGNPGSLTGINTFYKVSSGAFAPGGTLQNGMGLSQLGNPNLKWETLDDWNIGVDAGFFGNRLQANIDAFLRKRKNVILTKSLMSYNEIKTIDYNSKAVYESKGIDISLTSYNIDTRDFTWQTDFNFSLYRNRTTARDPEFIPAVYQGWVEDWDNIYGYKTNGLIQDGQTYVHLPKSGTGAINYLDNYSWVLDENGERMRDSEGRYLRTEGGDGVLDDADIVKLCNNTPIPVSLNNTFRWKNWDANIYIYGTFNGWKINEVKLQSVYGIEDITYGVNALKEVMNRWRPDNPNGTLPGVAEATSGVNPANSDFFLEKAWYLRLDNVSIGYTFPTKWFDNKIQNLRAYVAGRNLAVITPYKGMDPETGNGIGAYPSQWSVAFGLNLKF